MGEIRDAFDEVLLKGRLSEKAKQEIVIASRKSTFRFVPVVTLLVACLGVFLVWSVMNTPEMHETASISSEPGKVKDLHAEIVQLTNETLAYAGQGEMNPSIGEVFPMRLALEQDSNLFYVGSMLKREDKMLLSEFLHYLQEAQLLDMSLEMLQSVNSVEDLLKIAPRFIDIVSEQNGTSYKPIADEKLPMPILTWEYGQWISFVLIVLICSYLFLWLWRNYFRVAPILLALFGILILWSLFFNMDDVGYDEISMMQIVEKTLERQHVRIVGEATIEGLAGHSNDRYILLSYKDGLNVFGHFSAVNGRYEYSGAEWHSGEQFSAVSFLNWRENEWDDESGVMKIHTFVTTKNHQYKQLELQSNLGTVSFPIQPNEASIVMYKTAAKEMQLHYE